MLSRHYNFRFASTLKEAENHTISDLGKMSKRLFQKELVYSLCFNVILSPNYLYLPRNDTFQYKEKRYFVSRFLFLDCARNDALEMIDSESYNELKDISITQ